MDLNDYAHGFNWRMFKFNDICLVRVNQINGPRCNSAAITDRVVNLNDICYQSHNQKLNELLPGVKVPAIAKSDAGFNPCFPYPLYFIRMLKRTKDDFMTEKGDCHSFRRSQIKGWSTTLRW